MKGKVIYLLLSGLFAASACYAQYVVRGMVRGVDSKPIVGAQVFADNSFSFVSTDAKGGFVLPLDESGKYLLKASLPGLSTIEQVVEVDSLHRELYIEMRFTNVRTLQQVSIHSSGLGGKLDDKTLHTVMNKEDVQTTAGANMDIVNAMKTLPGAQKNSGGDGLYVRGGEGYETQMYIDGMLVNNFFYGGAPDVSHRGRFPPSLFKGTYFASGGYSAAYGQALSSVVIMESNDLPEMSELNINVGSTGVGTTFNKLTSSRFSYGGSLNYLNLQPYYGVIKQIYDFQQQPQFLDGAANFRWRSRNRKSILKFYASGAYSTLSLLRNSIDYDYRKDYYAMNSDNAYGNLTFNTTIGHWKMAAGVSASYNGDATTMAHIDNKLFDPRQLINSQQPATLYVIRNTWSSPQGRKVKWLSGWEYQQGKKNYTADSASHERMDTVHLDYKYHYMAVFTEATWHIYGKYSARLGMRGEYLNTTGEFKLSPRVMLNYDLDEDAQLYVSYGHFYQRPQTDLLLYKPDLHFMRATHYIAGFQKTIAEESTLRAEAFYKKYDKLVSLLPDTSVDGYGYAAGIELFWKSKIKSKNFDYWLSYSYTSSKRKYLDYPVYTQPAFISDQSFSLVLKQYVPKLSMHFAATYNIETGKPYAIPGAKVNDFMKEKTPLYNSADISCAYVRTINVGSLKNIYSIFALTVTNVFNNTQIYGYRYSTIDYTRRQALTPMAARFIYLGAFFSLGVDRTKEVFDANL